MKRTALLNLALNLIQFIAYIVIAVVSFTNDNETMIKILNEKLNSLTQWLSCYIIVVCVNIIYSSALFYAINLNRISVLSQFYNTIKILEHIVNFWGTVLVISVDTNEISELETTFVSSIIILKWSLLAIQLLSLILFLIQVFLFEKRRSLCSKSSPRTVISITPSI